MHDGAPKISVVDELGTQLAVRGETWDMGTSHHLEAILGGGELVAK